MNSDKTSKQNSIVLACDHAGFDLKERIKEYLGGLDLDVIDVGTHSGQSVDYPDYAGRAAREIEEGRASRGIIVCGSGIGISIAANRYPFIRAAHCQNGLMARLARQHNDANVLALGSRLIGIETALDCIQQFLNTDFEGGRHNRRVEKLQETR